MTEEEEADAALNDLSATIRSICAQSGLDFQAQVVAVGQVFFGLALESGSNKTDIIDFFDAFAIEYHQRLKQTRVN